MYAIATQSTLVCLYVEVYDLYVRPYFFSWAHHILLVLFRWFGRWELSDLLLGNASWICSKLHTASFYRKYFAFSVSRDSPRRRRGKTDTTPPVLNHHYLAVKKWPLRENVGHAGETRCSHLVTSGRRTLEGERERSQMIGWDPKMEVGLPSPQRK